MTNERPQSIDQSVRTIFLGLVIFLGLALLANPPLRAQGNVYGTDLFELGDGVDPAVPGIGDVAGDLVLDGPDWSDLFNADRSPKDELDEFGNAVSNGVPDFLDTWAAYRSRRDASFIADDVGADATVFLGPDVVGAGAVDPSYELGNAYAYTGFANLWNRVLYVGAERLTNADGSMVFEFNRKLFSLGEGGEILGERSVGDLQITIDFSAGILSSVAVGKWDFDVVQELFDWIPLQTLPVDPEEGAEQCNSAGTVCAVCNGVTIDGGDWPSYDSSGNPVTQLVPDTFMELGLNLSTLLGHNWRNFYTTRYATVQITSYDVSVPPVPVDYALGSFIRNSPAAQGGAQ